ncbi:hypothetical protein LTR17_018221 [Elasticomyces elasticus]|nr:hypothetical protein LTR17_018221 [Elasticomyces elasticus]
MANTQRLALPIRPATTILVSLHEVATFTPMRNPNASAVPEVNGSLIYCEEVDTSLALLVASLKVLVAIGSTTMLKGRATFRSEPMATLCKCTFPTTRTPLATATAAAITADATVTLEAPKVRTTEYP